MRSPVPGGAAQQSAAGAAGGVFAWSRAYPAVAIPAANDLLTGSLAPVVYASVQDAEPVAAGRALSFDYMRDLLFPVTPGPARQAATATAPSSPDSPWPPAPPSPPRTACAASTSCSSTPWRSARRLRPDGADQQLDNQAVPAAGAVLSGLLRLARGADQDSRELVHRARFLMRRSASKTEPPVTPRSGGSSTACSASARQTRKPQSTLGSA